MDKKFVYLLLLAILFFACENEGKYSFTDTPYLYGLVYPDSNPQWPFMFNLGYVRKNADNAYSSSPHKRIKDADVTLFWNNDSIKLTLYGDDEYTDYRDINLWAKPRLGDFLGVKASFDSTVMLWNGYLPETNPQCINLPSEWDTLDIWITERNIQDLEIGGQRKFDKGWVFVELAPTNNSKLKVYSCYNYDDPYNYRTFSFFTFKDTISLPVYVDTNQSYINLGVGYTHYDSAIVSAFLLDGFYFQKEHVKFDSELENYLINAEKLSLKERSNIMGDGVGLIIYQSSGGRRLVGRIRR